MRWNFYAAIDECYGGQSLKRVKEIANTYYHINWNKEEVVNSHFIKYQSTRTNLFFLFVDELHPMYNMSLSYQIWPLPSDIARRLERVYEDIEGGADKYSI